MLSLELGLAFSCGQSIQILRYLGRSNYPRCLGPEEDWSISGMPWQSVWHPSDNYMLRLDFGGRFSLFCHLTMPIWERTGQRNILFIFELKTKWNSSKFTLGPRPGTRFAMLSAHTIDVSSWWYQKCIFHILDLHHTQTVSNIIN